MKEIEQWVKSGAGVRDGLRLLALYRPNPYLARMVERHPEKYRRLLVRALTGRDPEPASEDRPSRTFREDWPFLSKPDCPMELKVLAADKITAWSGFAQEHEKLFDCLTPEQCLETAKNCIKFYCQNRKIFSEFAYYREHGRILGKHPIFKETQRLWELRTSGILELVRRQRNLRAAIWRLDSQLKGGTRPDLEADRSALLETKRRELAEVEKMIRDYESAYGKRPD